MIFFAYLACDNTDDTLMPVVRCQHIRRRVLAVSGDLFCRFCGYSLFCLLSELIYLAKTFRDGVRRFVVFSHEQLQRQRRTCDPSRRIEPRRNRKADSRSGDTLSSLQHARFFHERGKSLALCMLQKAKSRTDDETVFIGQRHDVGYRTDRYKLSVFLQHLCGVALKRADQLEHDADTGKCLIRI